MASHGWEHIRVNTQTPQEFRQDIERTRKLLEDISGEPVKGYRAASYSIGASEAWAWEQLAEAGYRYSSSIVPIRHDHYGMPGAPRFVFEAATVGYWRFPSPPCRWAGVILIAEVAAGSGCFPMHSPVGR